MSVIVWSTPVPCDGQLRRNSLRASLWMALLAYGVYSLALGITAEPGLLLLLLIVCGGLHGVAMIAFYLERDLVASVWMILVVLLCFTAMNTLAFSDDQGAEYYFILVPALIFMVLPPAQRELQISLLTLTAALLTLTFLVPAPERPWFPMSAEDYQRFKWLDIMVCFLCLAVVSRSFIRRLLQQRNLLERLALTDTLTGLPNRHGLMQRLAEWHNQGKSFAVLLVDVDEFRDINRRSGYDVGDMLMRKLAQRLRTDITETILIARVGGDQFMMATDEITAPQGIKDWMQRVQDSAARTSFDLNGRGERISISIGATLADLREQPRELTQRLTHALQLARQPGHGRMYFLAPEPGGNGDTSLALTSGSEVIARY